MAELSGNGMAGLAAVLFRRRLASSPLILQTPVGRRQVELLARRGPVFQLKVEIGRPDFSNRTFFPFLKNRQDRSLIDGLEFYPVSVGNPHAVVLCRERIGPRRSDRPGAKNRMPSHVPRPGQRGIRPLPRWRIAAGSFFMSGASVRPWHPPPAAPRYSRFCGGWERSGTA